MGVKFSELHILPTEEVASNDYLAVLDTSAGLLKRAKADHSSTTTEFGKGGPTKFGHVKLSDSYITEQGGAQEGIAASQLAVYNAYFNALNICQPTWIGGSEDWEEMPIEEKNKYEIVCFLDK